jgi:PHD/YefM family antitoxin component YafN of YafNO toxin-antitoxin module
MVLTISEHDWMKMKEALLDHDSDAAMEIVRELVKRLEIQAGKGMKSHLDGT